MRIPTLLVVALIAVTPACKGLNKKFQPTSKANMGFFADSTLTFLAELEGVLSRSDAVRAREFIHPDEPEETALRTSFERGFQIIRSMAVYSIELVTIVEAADEPKKQVEAYIAFMRPFAEQLCEACGVEGGIDEETLAAAAEAPKLIDAIRIAQPILGDAIREALMLGGEAERQLQVVGAKMDAAIDAEFADVIRYHEELEEVRASILRSIECVYRTRRGETGALDELRSLGTVHVTGLIPDGEPTPEELTAVSNHLVQRLDQLAQIRRAIDPDWQDFRAAHAEVDALLESGLGKINRFRVTVVVWMRAHQKMASGVVEPAQWFDINDTPALLFKLGEKAL